MAKEPTPISESKPWTPDQPLEDADDETEAQVRAKRAARLKHLEESYSKPAEPPKKKKTAFSW
jgi:hypothetical protein